MENDAPHDGGRRRDRFMGKLFGGSSANRERKMTNEENASDISDFLGTSDRLMVTHPLPPPPPTVPRGPPALALDTSKASRFPKALDVENKSQQSLAQRARSHSPPRPRKHKGLAVRFADSYPEIIGEGGDECQTIVAEIGRSKRSRSVPLSAPIPPTKEGHKYARQVGAFQEVHRRDNEFVPGPIRRTQTGFNTISDFRLDEPGPAPIPPPEPPKPRTIPAGEPVQSRFLDTNSQKDDNRRSFIEIHQQEQRQAEGMAFAEAMRSASANSHHQWDDPTSSPEPIRETPPRRKQMPLPTMQEPTPPPERSMSTREPSSVAPSLQDSISSLLRTQSTRSPLGPSPIQQVPIRSPSNRSPFPPPIQDLPQIPTSPNRSPLPPLPIQEALPDFDMVSIRSHRPMSPDELRISTNQTAESPSSLYSGSIHSTSDLSHKATPVTQNPASRGFLPSSPDKTSRSLHDAVVAAVAAGDDALETFIYRTKHLYELFRLHAEQFRPLGTSRPEDVCRAALWWFLRGRASLETIIRSRPADPEDTRLLMARYQAYTDLAKGYWLMELALPEIAEGKYSPVDGELGEVRQALISNLKKISGSMKRNGFLPPEEPFLPQTMDKSIWVEYPSVSQDIIALLNGIWGSALTAAKQPTRSMEALEALPLGDTARYFNYGRVPADVYLMERGMDSSQTRFPCMLSITRSQTDPNLNFVIASQNGSVSLRIQSEKNAGLTWQDVRWRPEAFSLDVRLPRGFYLEIQCSQPDFRMLWSMYDFSSKVQAYLYPRKDETVKHTTTLRGFHYLDANPQGRTFPKEPVGQCQIGLFERILKENSPTGPRTFHRGYRLAVVTGPRIRTLSGISHFFPPQFPIQFAMLRGDQRAPALQLDFNDGKEQGRMILTFNDEEEREILLRMITGTYVHHDEEVFAEVPLEGMNMSDGVGDTKGGFPAIQRLPWQRARIINDKYTGETPPTVLAEKLRVEVESLDRGGVGVVGTITDRVNVAPGELKLRLGTKDILTLQVLRQAQLDLTVSIHKQHVPQESHREFAGLQSTIQRGPTVRTYRFPSFKDLHAFQGGLTGYSVLFDGIAASLNISRRRMVVPVYKKWEAGTTRVQVVQQERTIQLLAFFEDWHHGQCMGFVLKGTDVFESVSRNGKAGLKLADAKFPLPRVPHDGGAKTDDLAFLCLDMPDFAGEHDDITILFEDSFGSRSSVDGADDDDTSVIEAEQGNVLMHIISQLRPGADLSRVVLPTFILEPRSMLERITNFMCHPEMLLPIPHIEDPVERFVSVVKFYLSGWHIKPPGVKKPLNPILGEVFSCYWDLPDNTRAYYISEQTSHHPPKSSYFYMAPDHHIRIDGTLKPRSKFLGNSAASLMEGIAVLTLTNRGKNRKQGERYWLTQPNMYARGILFGNMKYELGDRSLVQCPELGLTADVEFKTKGWVSGTYNAIGGTIKDDRTGQIIFELSGFWNEEMFIKDLRNGHKDMFFDARKVKPSKPRVRPIEEQDERESQKLWQKTAQAVKERNHELATDEKTKVEDQQRDEAASRAAAGVEWHPRLFRRVDKDYGGTGEGMANLEWIINAHIDGATPEKQAEQIMAIYPIIPGQKPGDWNIPPPNAASGHPHTAAKPAVEDNGADLIDFGQNETPAPAPAPIRPSKRDSKDISGMLRSTGRDAEGPLIDFTGDMKKDLPPAQLKKSDTAESHDDFFDAEG
ncbi:hypothetical protein F4677DRAFT_445543 [Hypoxylon crocopeplum]|nr:hypothetical protein F4677DRAFT_445543 [Hypoxylon crocopeplum]